MKRLLSDLQGHAQAWAFTKPVDRKLVPDYYEVVKNPMGEPVPLWFPMFQHLNDF